MSPVADELATYTGREVRNRSRSTGSTAASSADSSGPRWPMTGRAMAASTSGCTSVGPGRKNRPKSVAGGRWSVSVTMDPG